MGEIASSRVPPHFSWRRIVERKKEVLEREAKIRKVHAVALARITQFRYAPGYEEIKERVSDLLKQNKTVVVAVSGPQGSGKSSLVSRAAGELGGAMVSTDLYFLPPEIAERFPLYYDDPRAVKLSELVGHIKDWRNRGLGIKMPVHDLVTHKEAGVKSIPYKRVLFVEGFMAFHPKVRRLCDLKIFLEASQGKRLKRRLKRDVKTRGRKPAYVRDRFYSTLEESRLKYLENWRAKADLIIIS